MEYDSLRGTETMEFFRILKVYYKNLKRREAQAKHGKNIT